MVAIYMYHYQGEIIMKLTDIIIIQLTQRDVENTIDRETSGNFGKGLLTMGIPIF